jgi:hypothetical protein
MREFTFQTIDDPISVNVKRGTFYQYTIKRNRLFNEQFVTYKRIRKNSDWQVGEVVNVTLSPVAKPHVQLGCAKIVSIDKKSDNHFIYPETTSMSGDELTYEGFNQFDNWQFKRANFGDSYHDIKVFNKITLQWTTWNTNMIKIVLESGKFDF